mgnify:CR=1 FL=1
MKIIFLTFLLLFSINQVATAETCSRELLESAYQEKNFEIINDCFNNTSNKHPQWVNILLLQHKSLYQQKNWERFLGLSLFLRENNKMKTLLSSEIKDQIISLEALGWARLCRYKDAKNLVLRYSDELKTLNNNKISKVKNLLNLHDLPKSELSIESSSSIHWSISNTEFQKLTHPKNLRKKVQNLCESIRSSSPRGNGV